MKIALAVLNFFQHTFIAVWSMFWISLAAVLSLVTFNRELPLVMARRCWAGGIWRITGSRLRVEPLPDIDWSTPHVFVMNHQSMMDIPCAFETIPANIRFVAKHSLKYVPFLGWFMSLTKMIFINRSNRRAAVRSLREAGQRIREGANILAFPEGTRSPDGKILPFKKGPFVLALESGVPIIPVAIDGTGKVLSRHGLSLRPAEIRMKLGMPISTRDRSPRERESLLFEVRDALIQLHLEIGGAGGDAEAVAAVGREGRSLPTPPASAGPSHPALVGDQAP